jgi:hypothetical protein
MSVPLLPSGKHATATLVGMNVHYKQVSCQTAWENSKKLYYSLPVCSARSTVPLPPATIPVMPPECR